MPRDFLSWPQECPVSGLIRDCMGPEGRGPARAALARTGERVSDFPDASLHLLPGGCTASADSHSATGHALSLAPAPVTVIEFYPAAMARAEALIRSSKTAGSLITRNERRRRPSVVLARPPAHFLTGGNASELQCTPLASAGQRIRSCRQWRGPRRSRELAISDREFSLAESPVTGRCERGRARQ